MALGAGLTIGGIFLLALGVYFLAALIPPALDTLFSVNTDSWDAGSQALFTLIPLAIIGGIVILFIPHFGGGSE